MWAKQSTAATYIVGPILDSAGAEYTGAVIGDLSISKNGATLTALASAATLTHIANGQYTLVTTTGNTDTLGRAQVYCNKSTYQMPPLNLMIVPAMIFDSMVLGSDRLDTNVTHVADTAQTAKDLGAINVTNLNTLSSHDPGETIMGATDLGTGSGLTALATAASVTAVAGDVWAFDFATAGAFADSVGEWLYDLSQGGSTISATGLTALRAGYLDTLNTGVLVNASGLQTDAVQEIRNAITGGAYALDTDANGRIRIVDGTNAGEIDTTSGGVLVSALATQAKADVNAEVLDCLNTDTYAELGQGTPAATASYGTMMRYMYKGWRNKQTQTATEYSLYNDDGTTVGQKATVSDDLTTFTRGELATGA